MRLILSIIVVLAQVAAAAAQMPPEEDRPDETLGDRLRRHAVGLFRSFRELSDWDTHSAYMLEAVDKVYERNQWDSEADAFSLHMVHEVNTIPPWMPFERFERAMGLIGDRYGLDQQQEDLLRATVIRESSEMFQRHSGRIMSYMVEAIQTRAAGRPFTPEQVARWVRTAEPVFLESRERMNRMVQELRGELDPWQREILHRDMTAFNRRLDRVSEMQQRWARGDWEPSDWGLEEDPIQLGGLEDASQPEAPRSEPRVAETEHAPAEPVSGSARRAGGPAVVRREDADRPAGRAHDPLPKSSGAQPPEVKSPKESDPWAQYVERFIQKYKLDEGQQAQAWKIYRDVKSRADKWRSRYGQRIEAAGRRVKSIDDEESKAAVRELEAKLKATLDRLFEQLKERLERLPTRAQRRDASPENLDKPEQKKVKKPVEPLVHDGP